MRKYLIKGLAALGVATNAHASPMVNPKTSFELLPDWINNFMTDELPYTLAGHRSHSSHSSHGSHRSSTGGTIRKTPSYQPTPPVSTLPSKPTIKGNSSAYTEIAKQVQIELMVRNLYRGPIDGLIGPKSKEAIMRYQAMMGLNITGTIDALLRKMGLR